MEYSFIIATVSVGLVLVIGVALDFARREFTRKRNASRIGQALRRGISQPGGPWTPAPKELEWQRL